MTAESNRRHVVVLAPMPLEMDAITTAFGLSPQSDAKGSPWQGTVGDSMVTALHIGMGPQLTRAAAARLFDTSDPAHRRIDHMMIAGICGGLHPDLEIGTLINPEVVVDHTSGSTYRHTPPGDAPQAGKLITTEEVTLDHGRSRRFHEEGFLGVDMESAAVAEMCEAHGCPWSVYRCISDRYFDGLLDERIVALTNEDGSGNVEGILQLLQSEPELAEKLERLAGDVALAARLAAEAAVRGCLALDGRGAGANGS
jgi:adenosylhomocysteine nucleosidase